MEMPRRALFKRGNKSEGKVLSGVSAFGHSKRYQNAALSRSRRFASTFSIDIPTLSAMPSMSSSEYNEPTGSTRMRRVSERDRLAGRRRVLDLRGIASSVIAPSKDDVRLAWAWVEVSPFAVRERVPIREWRAP